MCKVLFKIFFNLKVVLCIIEITCKLYIATKLRKLYVLADNPVHVKLVTSFL